MPKTVHQRHVYPQTKHQETQETISGVSSQAGNFEDEIWTQSQSLPPTGAISINVAPSEAADDDVSYANFEDKYEGIDWDRLPQFMKPLRTQKRRMSWIYKHGYRVALRRQPDRTFFICRWCHQHKVIDSGGKGKYDVTRSTTTAANHLMQNSRGHNLSADGRARKHVSPGQMTLKGISAQGIDIPQEIGNAIGHFHVQKFRESVVDWLLTNNHPLRELETPAFKALIEAANPEATDALWANHQSVTSWVLREYDALLPTIKNHMAESLSKIHISFDGWTVRGGKKAFYGVVAHYLNRDAEIQEMPIALPQPSGFHSGERIAEIIVKTLENFDITPAKLGYFVLDNAYANDTAMEAIGTSYGFDPKARRIRCGAHTINLIGQTIMFGVDKDAFENDSSQCQLEEQFLQDWRKNGPLGVLIDVLNYIKTPRQHDLIREFQLKEAAQLPGKSRTPKEIVKPVTTRWNSFYSAFSRASELSQTINAYMQYHIQRIRTDSALRLARGLRAKESDVPSWMKEEPLDASDWQAITEYIQVLKPLELATRRLEGRGKSRRFGAIHEIIPTYEYVLRAYELTATAFESVDFNELDGPEDHLSYNVKAAWKKCDKYYKKLDDSPAYYAATILHPYYKNYCDNSWRDEPTWLMNSYNKFEGLWNTYKVDTPQSSTASLPYGYQPPGPLPKRLKLSDMQESIDQLANPVYISVEEEPDEYQKWKKLEPNLPYDHPFSKDPFSYWFSMQEKYPKLAQLAFDILSIPASSCDCERMFSELGDMLEPRRSKMSPQLIAAIQCVKSWRNNGFRRGSPPKTVSNELSNDTIDAIYSVCEWHNEN